MNTWPLNKPIMHSKIWKKNIFGFKFTVIYYAMYDYYYFFNLSMNLSMNLLLIFAEAILIHTFCRNTILTNTYKGFASLFNLKHLQKSEIKKSN